MRVVFFGIVSLLSIWITTAQDGNIEEKLALPASLSESSGVIFFNDKLITHNDSGGENKLFELDTISGAVTRMVTISNANNVDWEDIAQDDNYIYIGDIGNNSGARKDLKIYKVSKADYIASTNVIAETIAFNYSDQLDFTPAPNMTIWDAEALVSYNTNELILFTKNWVTGVTKAYPVPKTPGNYTINAMPSTLLSEGRISGATYNKLTNKFYLVGYTEILQPFVWECDMFNTTDVFSGINIKTNLSSLLFEQVEAITHVKANRYLLTSESFTIPPLSDYGKLIAFNTDDTVLSNDSQVSPDKISIYPNPVDRYLHIESIKPLYIEIYDIKQALVFKGVNSTIDMAAFQTGVYYLKIHASDNFIAVKKIIKK